MKKIIYLGSFFTLAVLVSCDKKVVYPSVNSEIAGDIYTVAGNGYDSPNSGGYSGDGGQATAAELWFPSGLSVTSSNAIYIADFYSNRIRLVTSSGIISTIAGGGSSGLGDGGQATNAELDTPIGVVLDNQGNIFIADQGEDRIRMVNTNGIITTLAGGSFNGLGDGGPATAATLYNPAGIAVDGSDNIYIAELYDNRIRKVNNSGIINTIAGNGMSGYSGDGGPATNAEINGPFGVAVDAVGNVYFDDNNYTMRKINTSGIISTIAGNGTGGYTGDGAAATAAEIGGCGDVFIDNYNNIFFTDVGYNSIRKISNTGIISTIAGVKVAGYSGDGGAAISAELHSPIGVAVDNKGDVYIGDAQNNRVREVIK
jgi:trimeric autotransporter adhesin